MGIWGGGQPLRSVQVVRLVPLPLRLPLSLCRVAVDVRNVPARGWPHHTAQPQRHESGVQRGQLNGSFWEGNCINKPMVQSQWWGISAQSSFPSKLMDTVAPFPRNRSISPDFYKTKDGAAGTRKYFPSCQV